MKTNQEQNETQTTEKEVYEKPDIEIIEMETEGNILAGSGDHYTPGGGKGW